jgi:predicted secreted Zn-dependent protease
VLLTISLALILVRLDGPPVDPPIVEQSDAYYDISAVSERGLALAMQRQSPGKPYPAYTEWRVSWVYQDIVAPDGGCRVATAQSKVQATVTMPRWTDSSWASDALRLTWNLRLREIRQHEQDHVQHGIAAAEAVQKALLALPPAESCNALKDEVQRTAQAIVEDAHRKDRAFDLQTAHGITGPTVRR